MDWQIPRDAATSSPGGVDGALLSVEGLCVEFHTRDGVVRAVDGVSYDIHPGETLGIVGESGSGKSVSLLSILGLIPRPPGRIVRGRALFRGRDLLRLSPEELRALRGRDVAMVFQDPMTSLNPVFRVGDQIAEAIELHNPRVGRRELRRRAVELMDLVGLPHPERRYGSYPHELSGGMRQRAMIAIAIANSPSLLIADEPTTALDVTIQRQILEALKTAQRQTRAATILITHDLGLIAEMADRVVVLYAGRVVEQGDIEQIFHQPRHPYTVGLMRSRPRLEVDQDALLPIPGQPPSLIRVPPGCAFHPRCFLHNGRRRCVDEVPALREVGEAGHRCACHFAEELAGSTEVSRATAD
jgi:oligopeptide/dipeptide ABC transporter ATP-binding protein